MNRQRVSARCEKKEILKQNCHRVTSTQVAKEQRLRENEDTEKLLSSNIQAVDSRLPMAFESDHLFACVAQRCRPTVRITTSHA